jgi:hypothetical protein
LINDLFREMSRQRKYHLCVEIFTKNIVTAAIDNKASFLYSETDYYESGSEGITRTVTSALCGDPKLVESISTLLSPTYSRRTPWDIDQWRAYYRLVLEAFISHVASNAPRRAAALHGARMRVTSIVDELNDDLQLTQLKIHDDLYLRLTALGDLIRDMVTVLDERMSAKLPIPQHATEDIVKLICSLIEDASRVRKPRIVARRIHHELIWSGILNSHELRTTIGQHIQQQVHGWLERTIHQCPDLDSSRLLGYSLNVLGFYPVKEAQKYGMYWRSFHMRLLEWTKENIATLITRFPGMEYDCFVEGMRYDAEHCRLVLEYPPDEKGEIHRDYLDVQPCQETTPPA